MSGKHWGEQEIEFLKNNCTNMSYEQLSKSLNRPKSSIEHKFSQFNLDRPPRSKRSKDFKECVVGDIVNGWKIVEIFKEKSGNKNTKMAKIESTLDNQKKHVALSILNKNRISHPLYRKVNDVLSTVLHGMSRTRIYSSWRSIIDRCNNDKSISYDNYGGRGIKICDEWLNCENFINWAINNNYQEDLTLDRIDVDKDYCPENCRWATKLQQTINKRNTKNIQLTAFGETKHIIEWSHDPRCVASLECINYRLKAGWDSEKILTTPTKMGFVGKNSITKWLSRHYPNIHEEYLNFKKNFKRGDS